MTTKDKLIDALSGAFSGKEEKRVLIPALLGTVISGKRIVAVPNRPGFVYVRLRGNYSEQIEAYNDSVNTVYDLPVLVERDRFSQSVYRVVSRDVGLYSATGWHGGAGLAPHGDQHSFGYSTGSGSDVVWVFKRQFMPLMVHPHPDPNKTLWIQAEEDWYTWGRDYLHFTGSTMSIAGAIPSTSNESRFMLFYVDADAQLKAHTGTTFTTFPYPDNQTLLNAIPDLTVNEGISLCAMVLHSTTTELEWGQFYDTRSMLNGGMVQAGNSFVLIDTSAGYYIEYPPTAAGFQSAINDSDDNDAILYPITTVTGNFSLKRNTALIGQSEFKSKLIGTLTVSNNSVDRLNFSTYTTGTVSILINTPYPTIYVNTGTFQITNSIINNIGLQNKAVAVPIYMRGTGSVFVRNSYLQFHSLNTTTPAYGFYNAPLSNYWIEAHYNTFAEYGDNADPISNLWRINNTGTVNHYANSWPYSYGYGNENSSLRDGDRAKFNHNHTGTSSNYLFGTSPDYIQISSSGTLQLLGGATVFDDLTFPAQSSKLGGLSDPDFSQYKTNGTGSRGVYTYLFDATREEEIFLVAQMSHTWKIGSFISPHVHWSPTTNATGVSVVWGLEYEWININGIAGNTKVITAADPCNGIAGYQQLAEFPDIDGTGKTLSSIILARLYRMPSHPLDTYTADAALLSFDIHYEIDSLGSNQEYIK